MKKLILLSIILPALLSAQTTAMVPMRDSVKLATNIYLPPDTANGAVPVVLCRTPYGRGPAGIFQDSLFAHGIGYVSQDTRGRGGSEGVDSLFLNDGWGDKQDGYDTVEWLAQQPWCNGKIGVYGGSAYGITAYLCAGSLPPHLVCGFVAHCASSLYHHAVFPGGCYRKEQVDGWTLFMHLTSLKNLMIEHYIYDPFWDTTNLENRIELLNVPFYQIAGWYDTFCEGNIDAFQGLQLRGADLAQGNQKIIIGPWTHGNWLNRKQGELFYPENSRWDMVPVATQWFAHYLKGEENGIETIPPVQCYVMGACLNETNAPGNEWSWFNNWPPDHIVYDTLYFHLDKSLSKTKPDESGDSLTFYHKPGAPLYCNGGRNLLWFSGPRNQFFQDISPQNLIWTTEPLTESITITGKVLAKIYLSSDCIDTDIMVRIEDVYPNGQSFLVMDGALKTRFRDGFDQEIFMTPYEIYELEIDVGNIAMSFAPGHRIRVGVSSALFPRYDMNPNTGEPFRQHTYTKVAHNAIHTNRDHASCIIFPTLQSETSVAQIEDKTTPNGFTLDQNYPNPFNQTTTIGFSLSKTTFVSLTIYDILGHEIDVLINKKMNQGRHTIVFDAKHLSSGIYFYKLKVGDSKIKTKKFILLK